MVGLGHINGYRVPWCAGGSPSRKSQGSSNASNPILCPITDFIGHKPKKKSRLVCKTEAYFIVLYQRVEARSGQSDGGGQVAARPVKNEARSSTLGISFKADLVISHLGEKLILAFRKQLKLRHSGQIARLLARQLCMRGWVSGDELTRSSPEAFAGTRNNKNHPRDKLISVSARKVSP